MANDERGLRRRLMLAALDLKPGDVRRATGAHSVRVTAVLNGHARLRPDESKPVIRLFGRRARQLFEADE
jgi:hypothetical protein